MVYLGASIPENSHNIPQWQKKKDEANRDNLEAISDHEIAKHSE